MELKDTYVRKDYIENVNIKFAKTNPNAVIPSKEEENAGYDIYACLDEDYIIIPPHTTQLVPTGIASAFDAGYYIQIEERGSTGSKGMKKSAGVIDSGYRGQWFVAITNTNNVDIIISKYPSTKLSNIKEVLSKDFKCFKKIRARRRLKRAVFYPATKAIAQAIIHIVPKSAVEEITFNELQTIASNRGTGVLGSSGK